MEQSKHYWSILEKVQLELREAVVSLDWNSFQVRVTALMVDLPFSPLHTVMKPYSSSSSAELIYSTSKQEKIPAFSAFHFHNHMEAKTPPHPPSAGKDIAYPRDQESDLSRLRRDPWQDSPELKENEAINASPQNYAIRYQDTRYNSAYFQYISFMGQGSSVKEQEAISTRRAIVDDLVHLHFGKDVLFTAHNNNSSVEIMSPKSNPQTRTKRSRSRKYRNPSAPLAYKAAIKAPTSQVAIKTQIPAIHPDHDPLSCKVHMRPFAYRHAPEHIPEPFASSEK
jgi:hypothetical protein